MASIVYKQITSIEEAYDAFHTTIDANFTAVKQEYHKLALLNHPDKNGGHDFAFFQHISFAFQVIHSRHEKEMRKLVKHDTKRKHAGENRDNTNSSHNESQASESNERWEESQAADKKKWKEEFRANRAKWAAFRAKQAKLDEEWEKQREKDLARMSQFLADYEKRWGEKRSNRSDSESDYDEKKRSEKESERRARKATKAAMYADRAAFVAQDALRKRKHCMKMQEKEREA